MSRKKRVYSPEKATVSKKTITDTTPYQDNENPITLMFNAFQNSRDPLDEAALLAGLQLTPSPTPPTQKPNS